MPRTKSIKYCPRCDRDLPVSAFDRTFKPNGRDNGYKSICHNCGKHKVPLLSPNPSGLCMCGCGQKTEIADVTHVSRGRVKGQSYRFIQGHNAKSNVKECANCREVLSIEVFDRDPGPRGIGRGFKKSCRTCVATWREKQRQRAIDNIPERFWSNVDRSGGPDACWPWTQVCSPSGYGVITIRTLEGRDEIRANRMALMLAGVDIPEGMLACHHCDNPPCCNPTHLFVGTPADNTHDAQRKGRLKQALTPEDVIMLRRLYREGAGSYRELAERFGFNQATVGDAISGVTWKDVVDDAA